MGNSVGVSVGSGVGVNVGVGVMPAVTGIVCSRLQTLSGNTKISVISIVFTK